MQRRSFMILLGGMVGWPVCGRAQLSERMHRVGVLSAVEEMNGEQQRRFDAFRQELQRLGWNEGANLQIDYRWGPGADKLYKSAVELVSRAPDVIVATGAASVEPVLQVTRSVPIVFTIVPDPVGAGLIESLSRPGGNATGFVQFEYSLCAKWPELLKEIAPNVTRIAVLRDAAITAGVGQFAVIQSVAPALRMEVSPISVKDAYEIERATTAFARSPNGGLILTASGLGYFHRDLIIALAAHHKLPAVFSNPENAAAGGLLAYGPNFTDQFRRAASYVDRILRGAKPADLPVQTPTKYELVINLKTANALGLTIPESLLVRADGVIE